MCIIAYASAKRFLKEDVVKRCMDVNPAGFFMAAYPKFGKPRFIRTLDKGELLKFYNEQSRWAKIVLHARIPSVGQKTLDNVHGWEVDGVRFCHNMTIHGMHERIQEEKMGDMTDSEFFFRHVFMPAYRLIGADRAFDGKRFCPYLDRLASLFCGERNKFLFLLPKGQIVTYGQWYKGENGRSWFSNEGYKPAPVYDYPRHGYFNGWFSTPVRGESNMARQGRYLNEIRNRKNKDPRPAEDDWPDELDCSLFGF